jgi:putrescine:ornithine antiporter
MALMVMSCCGSLLGWQFTIAQVFKSSADEGYFPKVFSQVSKADAPVKGMLVIVVIQSGRHDDHQPVAEQSVQRAG